MHGDWELGRKDYEAVTKRLEIWRAAFSRPPERMAILLVRAEGRRARRGRFDDLKDRCAIISILRGGLCGSVREARE